MDPNGKVVLITGASSGIGAAAARCFAAAGANVVLAARSADKLEQLAASLPGAPLVVPTDVSVAADVQRLVAQTVDAHGRLDIVINNAGVGLAGPIATIDPHDVERAFAVDLLGPLHVIQAAVPVMRQQQRGHIINISSVVSVQPLPYLGGYAAAKAALDRMSEALRMELRGGGIAVTVVRPGTTSTGFADRRLGQGREQRRVTSRGVAPEVVAQTLLRAARREPRIAYVSRTDRVRLLVATLLPALTEQALARSFAWHEDERL